MPHTRHAGRHGGVALCRIQAGSRQSASYAPGWGPAAAPGHPMEVTRCARQAGSSQPWLTAGFSSLSDNECK